MFSSAVSRAMSTCRRKESKCSRMVNSDSMDILLISSVDSPIFVRSDLNLAIELDKEDTYINKLAHKILLERIFPIIVHCAHLSSAVDSSVDTRLVGPEELSFFASPSALDAPCVEAPLAAFCADIIYIYN